MTARHLTRKILRVAEAIERCGYGYAWFGWEPGGAILYCRSDGAKRGTLDRKIYFQGPALLDVWQHFLVVGLVVPNYPQLLHHGLRADAIHISIGLTGTNVFFVYKALPGSPLP